MWTNNSIENLIKGVMRHGPEVLENCVANPNDILRYINQLDKEHLNYPITKLEINKDNWFIPFEYKNMDIEGFLVNECPKENYDRLIQELELYRKHNMIPVLKTIKYIVDTLRSNNIVWGVGRGSSVSSYVLYLIGIHKIDSVKYRLPIEEFFKGE